MSIYFKENKYFKWYMNICSNAQTRATTRYDANKLIDCVEMHHIIPTSFCKELQNIKSNKAFLSTREHFIVHKLLIKCATSKYKGKAIKAVCAFSMANSRMYRNFTSYDYEYLRKQHILSMSGENSPSYGKPGSTTNKICINNGKNSKFISSEDVESYLSTGWIYGSHKKNNIIIITNGTTNSSITIDEEIPIGWYTGSSLKDKQSPLKDRIVGKYSDSRCTNMSIAAIGKIWITDNIIDRKILKTEQIPSGWRKGRTNGVSKTSNFSLMR